MSEVPTVEVFAVTGHDGPVHVSVKCPYCGQIHAHRFDDRRRALERTARCSTHEHVLRYRVAL